LKVFLTGGTGFIGRHLIELLAGSGHEAICLARRSSDTSRIREVGFEVALGDVTDRNSLRSAMTGCDCVMNLANLYSMWERDKSSSAG